MRYFVTIHGEPVEIELGPSRDGRTTARIVRAASASASEHVLELLPIDGLARCAVRLDGRVHDVLRDEPAARRAEHDSVLTLDGVRHLVAIEDERERAAHLAAARAPQGPVAIRSAMPGIVREILVKPGQPVAAGQPVLILEAMKMENELRAEHAGVVRELKVAAGTPVESGAELVVIDPAASGSSASETGGRGPSPVA